jgi:uncharacterized membrane protein
MTSSHRRVFLDWARGVAVLLMIEAHSVDAWTRLNVRHTVLFRDATILGGFAAPLFLWLAGVAVALAATRNAERTGSRRAAAQSICSRGLEIFILAFLFRLQGFVVTPGSHPVMLFRVDILNIMGPAIAVGGIVWGSARTTTARVIYYTAITATFAMAAPIVRGAQFVDSLPMWLQWYVRPFGDFTIFTLFPWAGFVFAGGAAGVMIAAARDERSERRLHASLAAVGVTLILVGLYTASRPSIYASSSFWTSSPTWFAIRLGILMIALTGFYAVDQFLRQAWKGTSTPRSLRETAMSWSGPLAAMGRSSLFIYWIHVELVYGYASWMWRHRLPLWGTAAACALFCVLMYKAIGWRDLAVHWWRNWLGRRRDAPQAATA